jgi:hypothetical protein
LQKLYQADLSGKKALQLRKQIKKLQNELDTFTEARDDYIKRNGENGEIKPESEAYQGLIDLLNEMAGEEIESQVKPVLTDANIESINLSVKDIDTLEAIGLYEAKE